MKIVCVGDCGVDHYLPEGLLVCGGITSNYARQTRRIAPADDRIAVISAVGDDEYAARLARSAIEVAGIDADVVSMAGRTPVQFIEIEADGERHFVRYDEGVLRDFRVDERGRQQIATADWLVTPVFRQIHALFDSVMAAPPPAMTAVDFADFAEHPDFEHLEKYLARIDLAFFGLTVDHVDEIRTIRQLAAAHDKLLIVTLGAAGCRAFHGDVEYRRAAIPVARVLDTTGAGDAFAAAFLSRFAHGASVRESLDSGAALAAGAVQQQGAVPQ